MSGGAGLTDESRELVRYLGTRFIARKDVKAFQRSDGAWFPDRTPFTMSNFRDHLNGSETLGHYMLSEQDTCKYFAYDIDLVKHDRGCSTQGCKGCTTRVEELILNENGNPQKTGAVFDCNPRLSFAHQDDPAYRTLLINLRLLSEGLARLINRHLQIPVAIAYSGNKGLHVYGFTGEVAATAAKEIALTLLHDAGPFEAFRGNHFWRHTHEYTMLDIEVFPKQVSLEGKDLGNLMALPLGRHQVTKNEKFFITTQALPDRLVPKDPMKVLSGDLPWE